MQQPLVLALFAGFIPSVICMSLTKPRSPKTSEYDFADFVKEYGRAYEPNTKEWTEREAIFLKRMQHVNMHKSKPNAKWQADVTRFMDYTDAEYQQLMGYKRKAHSKKRAPQSSLTQQSFDKLGAPHDEKHAPLPPGSCNYTLDNEAIPNKVDWRELVDKDARKFVVFNRDQGQCGSCWAVATANVMDFYVQKEAAMMKKLKGQLHNSDFPTMSTQSVLSCTENLAHCGGDGGCQGATMQLAFAQIMNMGAPLAESYPYTSSRGSDSQCDKDKMASSLITLSGYYQLPSNTEAHLLQAVAREGAIGVSVDATEWMYYSHGVFDGCGDSFTVNHAVVLYGYQKPKDGEDGYWLIKNSWGRDWGESGFIRIQMLANEEGHCGMDMNAHEGTACDGDPDEDMVCGSCGILYDSSFPKGTKLLHANSSEESGSASDSEQSSDAKDSSKTADSSTGKIVADFRVLVLLLTCAILNGRH